LLEQKSIRVSTAEGLLKVKSNTTSDPSVAEAGVIVVATVGALLLSIIVPVAETVPLAMLKFRPLHQLYPQLLVPIPFQ
jgi:hypothetical protein